MQIWGKIDTTDGLGNRIGAWTLDKGSIKGMVSRPTASESLLYVGAISNTDKKIILSAVAIIATTDRIEIDGLTYKCIGKAEEWLIKKRGAEHHKEIYLKLIKENV